MKRDARAPGVLAGAGQGSGESAGHRHQRLEVSVREELQSIIRDDVTDPELEGVVVGAVVLSPDYRNARVHFLVPRGRPRTAVERAFTRASPFLRARLAEGVELKRTPELRFVYEAELDPSKPQ